MGSPLNRMVNRFDAHCIISRPDISSQPSYLVRAPVFAAMSGLVSVGRDLEHGLT
jgi:hypothetical protein